MKWRPSVLLVLAGLGSLTHCRIPLYHFIDTPLPWLKAQRYCRERYTDLATVFDINEMNQLVNTAQDSTGGFTGMAWIGLHDNLTSWRWSLSDISYNQEDNSNYRKWDVGQPDNFFGDQMCVKMQRGVWDDFPCHVKSPFVCYDGTNNAEQNFIFVQRSLSWSDAQKYCRTYHTDLAIIRDETENQEIQRLTIYGSAWIGLYRTREWSDRSVSTYRYWNHGQPDNVGGKQLCTATNLGNAGRWSDEECNRQLVFICYGDENKTPTMPFLSTISTTVTPDVTTTMERDSPSPEIISPEQPSTSPTDETITDETLSPATMTSIEGSSTITEASSQRCSTPKGDQTGNAEHVISLRVKFTSEIKLTEDEIKEMLLVQFQGLLEETGHPANITLGLKVLKTERKELTDGGQTEK